MTADAFSALRASAAFESLLAVSERLGRDPLQVQGPGGNTSVKADGAMWVKASGTWLADAREREIMVPVDQAELAAAVRGGGAVKAIDFVPPGMARDGLRPSIETSVHAVMPQHVVLHTHCVATIALAIRTDGAEIVRDSLADLDPILVPYVMPGEPLARALAAEGAPHRRVAILGNHGLIVAGDAPEETEALLRTVSARLEAEQILPGAALTADLTTAVYRPADAPSLHAVTQSPAHLAIAMAGPFYPDHVVFLGADLAIAGEGETLEAAAAEHPEPPILVLLPGVGAAIRRDASPAAEAMARCLGDVIARVSPGAPVAALGSGEIAALLGWDAEKHRQTMSAGPSA